MEKIILLGAGGHAKTIVDTIERNGNYEIEGFIDMEYSNQEVYSSYKVIGNDSDLINLYDKGISNAFVCIGYMGRGEIRQKLYHNLKTIGYRIPAIVDQSAIVSSNVKISEGTYIGKRTVINADTRIGRMSILNTASLIEHECIIGDFSHVAVGAVICGQSVIGDNVFIGANATVIQNITVEQGCIIGAGSVVVKNLSEGCTAVGVPAKVIK